MVTGTYYTYHNQMSEYLAIDYAKALASIPEFPLFSITADLQK